MKRPAIFIDRDGTINEEMGYINHLKRFVLLPGVGKAVELLNRHGYWVIVISNQSGVARGYFPVELVHSVHSYMKTLLKKEDAIVDGIFFCPHYPNGVIPEYSISCNCRKPATGLIHNACKKFDVDVTKSYVIGDRLTDIEMAKRFGLEGILVTTGYGLGEEKFVLPKSPFEPTYIAKDLLHAVQWIVKKGKG